MHEVHDKDTNSVSEVVHGISFVLVLKHDPTEDREMLVRKRKLSLLKLHAEVCDNIFAYMISPSEHKGYVYVHTLKKQRGWSGQEFINLLLQICCQLRCELAIQFHYQSDFDIGSEQGLQYIIY
jgi:hypothetical protein